MLVKEIDRSSVISWSPIPRHSNLLVGGTLSGTMSSDFDPSGKLELFDLSKSDDKSVKLIGSCQVKERFNVIGWKNANPNTFEYGLVVGGFNTGTLGIYDPAKILRNDQSFVVAEVKSHSSSLNSLEFNPFQSSLLASGGSNSEVFIWNLADPTKPSVYTPGDSPSSQTNSDIVSTTWNSKHKHILSTCARNGSIAIWDLREKRPIFSFADPSKRARYKSISWHPDQPMQIAAASFDDDCPVIHLWDLKMTVDPSRSFTGHSRGIACMDWCREDTSLLVSGGKDNRMICWDINSGESICDIGTSSNYNFDLKWSPLMPTTLASSSLDGKIRVYSLQDFTTQQPQSSSNFGNFQTTNPIPKRPPGWLIPRAGARFSFGGKLVSFNKNSKNIQIDCIVTESRLIEDAKKLESTLYNGSYVEFCEEKIKSLGTQTSTEAEEEKLMWSFIKSSLNGENARRDLLSHLSYDVSTMQNTIDQYLSGLPKSAELEEVENENAPMAPINEVLASDSLIDDFALLEKRGLEMQKKNEKKKIDFSNVNKNDSVIMTCLITGNIESAIECCIRNGNMADALAIASSGGDKLWEKTLKVYFKQNQTKSYVSILNAISTKDFKNFVECVDLKFWKEALALLCTYAEKESFQVLCLILGDRLKNELNDSRKATLCYICSGEIDKVAPYWTDKVIESKNYSGDNLHQLIEKLFVLSKAMNSNNDKMTEYVGQFYQSYSEILSSQGCLSLALYFLNSVKGNTSQNYHILMDRLYHSLGQKAKSIISSPPPFPFQTAPQSVSNNQMNHQQKQYQQPQYQQEVNRSKPYQQQYSSNGTQSQSPKLHKPLITPNQNTLPMYQSKTSHVQSNPQQVQPNTQQFQPNLQVQPNIHQGQQNLQQVQPNIQPFQPNVRLVQPNTQQVQPNIPNVQQNTFQSPSHFQPSTIQQPTTIQQPKPTTQTQSFKSSPQNFKPSYTPNLNQKPLFQPSNIQSSTSSPVVLNSSVENKYQQPYFPVNSVNNQQSYPSQNTSQTMLQPQHLQQPSHIHTSFKPKIPSTLSPVVLNSNQSNTYNQPSPVVLNPNSPQQTQNVMNNPPQLTQNIMNPYQSTSPLNTLQPTQNTSPQSSTPPPPPKGKGRRKLNGNGRKQRTLG